MQRTQNRALVKKTVSVPIALIYSVVLGIIGFNILWFGVNAYAFRFALHWFCGLCRLLQSIEPNAQQFIKPLLAVFQAQAHL